MLTSSLAERYQSANRSLLRRARRQAAHAETWGYRLHLFLIRATLPTIDALGLAAIVGLLVVVATYGLSLVVVPALQDSDARQVLLTLWQVQAGMAGIALPVLLFVIEISRAGLAGGTRTHEVLLRRTLLVPILACAIGGTILTGCYVLQGRPSAVMIPHFVFVFIGTMAATLYAFYQVVRLTFSEPELDRAAIELVREKMRLSVDRSAVQRIANNMLLGDTIPSTKVMTYNPFEPDDKADHVVVHAQSSGTLVDVDPFLLNSLAGQFVLNATVGAARRPSGDALATEVTPPQPSRPAVRWMRLLGDRLREGRTPMLAFDRATYATLDPNVVAARVNQLVTVSADDHSELLRNELGYLRDVVIEAIQSGNTRRVEGRLDLHEELLREFLDSLRRWGAAYTPDTTARDDSVPFRRYNWSELQWLEDDFREFAIAAVRQSDARFARLVIGAAYSIALYAVGEREYYVYSHAVDLMTYPYRAGLRDLSSVEASVVRQAAEHTAFMLKEMGQLRLTHEIGRPAGTNELQFARNCGLKLLRSLGQLAKEASDADRVEDWAVFVEALGTAFSRLEQQQIRRPRR